MNLSRILRDFGLPLICCTLYTLEGRSSNIQIANAGLTGSTGTSAMVQFDLSWENSWRGGAVANWDAAWVFVKYRTSPTGPWLHANLSNTGHVAAAGSQIDVGLLTPGTAYNASTNPVLGAFVYRNAVGTGNLSLPATQLQWNFGALGLNYSDIAQVQVFAIEMVYVPQGSFAAGSGGTETNVFSLTTINTATASTIPGGTGSLGGQAGGYPTGQTAPSIFTWPNGFAAFYCMKYELSQQQYTDFLNTLTYAQQDNRTSTAPTSAIGTGALISTNILRNGIEIQTPGVDASLPAVYACNLNGNGTVGEATDGTDLPCNYLSWGDQAGYLDWSGLRPFTELEFEKACRGTIAPVPGEFPWGTTDVASTVYTLADPGATNEGIASGFSTTLGNANYGTTNGGNSGPWRVGIFAANVGNTGRETAGASYYGIMELAGNLQERTVNIATPEGRAFTGAHGNGALAADGNPNVTSWPATATGLGTSVRGSHFNTNPSSFMRVSDRPNPGTAVPGRDITNGARGVRTAP